MKNVLTPSNRLGTCLSALAGLALCLPAPLVTAQSSKDIQSSKTLMEPVQSRTLPSAEHRQVAYSTYILGPGDQLRIELLDLPELSGIFTIGPDGTIFLPRLRALQVEGLTIEELRSSLTNQFKQYVREPEVFITPVGYRAVRVYVGGEVARPGFYTISASEVIRDFTFSGKIQRFDANQLGDSRANSFLSRTSRSASSLSNRSTGLSMQSPAPTLFDALQAASGVTPFSQLGSVQITRKRPSSQGGGKVRADVDFLRLISDGDESVNIRLYDGDSIFVSKSNDVLRDQLLAASRTNLSPDFIAVFVSGRVKEPGAQELPQGATLNQAIASAGGPKLLRGRVEFLRFTQEGATDRRLFAYKPKAASGDYRNPVLMQGDVIRVNESLISASLEVINEITAPALGFYSVRSIFKDF